MEIYEAVEFIKKKYSYYIYLISAYKQWLHSICYTPNYIRYNGLFLFKFASFMVGLRVTTEASNAFVICISPIFNSS